MYLEFFILIFDYYKTLKFRIVLYEIVIPILISCLLFFLLLNGKDTSICKGFSDNALTLLGILLGFSITVITILTTGNSKNLLAIQTIETNYIIGGKKVTLFDLLLVNFTYSVVIEIVLIIILLISPLLISNLVFSQFTKILVFAIFAGTVIHILLLTMRNLTDFYLILMKK